MPSGIWVQPRCACAPDRSTVTSATGPSFVVDLRAATAHLVAVELTAQPSAPTLRWSLPAWTPGSYLIRDYVRQLEGLNLTQADRPIAVRRTGVAAWEAELPDLQPVRLRYQLVATELSVRTCHLDADHGFLCLAAVAVEIEGQRWRPQRISLQLPPGWQGHVPLPQRADGSWCAQDFDQLVDTPIEAGPHASHGFDVAGIPHRWVSWGTTLAGVDPIEADGQLLADVERVCGACCRLMGVERPAADHYLFVLHLTEAGYGGLEHDCSSVLQYGRRRLAQPDGRRKLLQLVAHEYLHQWNVRRLRPAELTPYNYRDPVSIPTLWFAEGVTSYVDQLLPHAAGISDSTEVLADLASDLSRYWLTPGRHVQSLRQSSEEAWVKLYKADAYAINSQVSYYLKGAVLALVLDLHLRRRGSGLPAVLRQLWQSHGRWGRGYREAELLAAFARADADLARLLPAWLNGTEDPDLEPYLADVGLLLTPHPAAVHWLGWMVERSDGGGLQLKRVIRSGPAERAGLMVGDELLAVAGWRLHQPEDLAPVLAALQPGAELEVAYARDGRLRCAQLQAAPAQVERWSLEPDRQATAAALERRRRWLCLELP